MNVNSVASVFNIYKVSKFLKGFILEKSHMNVKNVTSVLAQRVALEDTKKSTLKQGGVQ